MLRQGKMIRVIRWVGTGLKYGAGMLCWLIVFGILQQQCIFDITSVVDRLWLKDLQHNLVEDMLGEIAYHVRGGRCVDTYLYNARYHPSRMDLEGEVRSLTSLVDVKTWTGGKVEGNTITYLDAKHRYTLFVISDDEYIKAVNR